MTELDRIKHVMLCRPEYFQLLPINEMARHYLGQNRQASLEACLAEHRELADAYRSQDIEVSYVDAHPDLRYQVFTRDPAFLTDKGLVLGRMFERSRMGEEEAMTRALPDRVSPVVELSEEGAFLEGGDVAFLDGQTVAVGVGARSNGSGAAWLGSLLAPCGIEVIRVPFDPAYLHLDIIFSMVAPQTALAVTPALPGPFLDRLRAMKFEIIDVDEEQARDVLACNVVATGRDSVISVLRNSEVNRKLRALGLEVLDPDIHQLLMGGGGPRCLTLPIERDPGT